MVLRFDRRNAGILAPFCPKTIRIERLPWHDSHCTSGRVFVRGVPSDCGREEKERAYFLECFAPPASWLDEGTVIRGYADLRNFISGKRLLRKAKKNQLGLQIEIVGEFPFAVGEGKNPREYEGMLLGVKSIVKNDHPDTSDITSRGVIVSNKITIDRKSIAPGVEKFAERFLGN